MSCRLGFICKIFTALKRRFVAKFYTVVLIFVFIIVINPPQRLTPLPKEVKGWEFKVSRNTRDYIQPDKETSIISGSDICKGTFNLIIIVCSAPENLAQRTAIRETWGSYNTPTVKVAFLLGLSKNSNSQVLVEKENAQFQDLIQEDFIDSYNNLTIKSVMMLKWFNNKCLSPNFLMKTDDDMFINTEHLSAILSKMDSHSVLIGSVICNSKPIRDPNNKWFSPKYMYQKAIFPNYLSGTAYVMSRDVASKIYRATFSTPLNHLEDLYLTGICAEKVGIRPRSHPAFAAREQYILGMGCFPDLVTSHALNPYLLRLVWNLRNNCTQLVRPTILPNPENQCD